MDLIPYLTLLGLALFSFNPNDPVKWQTEQYIKIANQNASN